MIIGPFWAIGRFWLNEADRVIDGEPGARRIWIEHALWCVPVIAYLHFVGHLPIWLYFLSIAVPATSIMLIRSFCEHRAVPGVRERVAIVENSWVLGPIFLFNSLHALHHENPTLPWYRYLAVYRDNRERLIKENGGLVYNSYFDIARRYLFRPHDQVEHPMGRIPRGKV
jgi:fatty acid desaturase